MPFKMSQKAREGKAHFIPRATQCALHKIDIKLESEIKTSTLSLKNLNKIKILKWQEKRKENSV